MNFDKIIRQIAKNNGVSPETVRKEIQEAIKIGKASTDPLVQLNWNRISPTGKEPTIDEFLTYIVSSVIK